MNFQAYRGWGERCPGRPRGSGRRARCRRRSRVENAGRTRRRVRPARREAAMSTNTRVAPAYRGGSKAYPGGYLRPNTRLWFCHGTSGSVWGSAPQPGGYRRPVTRRERENRARGEWQTYREITRAGAKRAGVESLEYRRREGRIGVRINPSGHFANNQRDERAGGARSRRFERVDRSRLAPKIDIRSLNESTKPARIGRGGETRV